MMLPYDTISVMQTIQDFGHTLGLSEEQKLKLEEYITQLVAELLESIKEDNIKNFDETIKNLKG
jgi:hypothetical protein